MSLPGFDAWLMRLADEEFADMRDRDDYDDDDYDAHEAADPQDEDNACRDCGAEFDHEPDCMTAAALLQAMEEGEPPASDAEYGRAIRPLVEALASLFTEHNRRKP